MTQDSWTFWTLDRSARGIIFIQTGLCNWTFVSLKTKYKYRTIIFSFSSDSLRFQVLPLSVSSQAASSAAAFAASHSSRMIWHQTRYMQHSCWTQRQKLDQAARCKGCRRSAPHLWPLQPLLSCLWHLHHQSLKRQQPLYKVVLLPSFFWFLLILDFSISVVLIIGTYKIDCVPLPDSIPSVSGLLTSDK